MASVLGQGSGFRGKHFQEQVPAEDLILGSRGSARGKGLGFGVQVLGFSEFRMV